MKKINVMAGMLLALLTFSCNPDDTAPQPVTEGQALKVSKIIRNANQHYEFSYNAKGQLSQVKEFIGNELTSADEIVYDSQDRISSTISLLEEQPIETRYRYSNGILTNTEQFYHNQLAVICNYEYDSKKRLVAETKFEPEGSNLKPLVKYTYTYDNRHNVHVKTQYQPQNGNWEYFRTYTYEDYDNSPYVEQATLYPVMPAAHLHKNNFRKLTITNWLNEAEFVYAYTFAYNSKNLPVKKTTHASNGSFELVYEYMD